MCTNLALTAYFLRTFKEILDEKLDVKIYSFTECWSINIIVFLEPRIAKEIIVVVTLVF